MIRSTTKRGTSLLGFSRISSRQHNYSQPQTRKAFGITDRPVYQPSQKVYGKFWVRDARYDLADVSNYAGKKFLPLHQ